MSFFVRKRGGQKGRGRGALKRGDGEAGRGKGGRAKRLKETEVSSDSEVEEERGAGVVEEVDFEEETEQEKRFRLAKVYLADLEKKQIEAAEDKELDRETIGLRLKTQVLEDAGKLHRKFASLLEVPVKTQIRVFRGHKLSPTALVVSNDGKFAVSASKDGCIIKWNLETGKIRNRIASCSRKKSDENTKGHFGSVKTLALSTDDKLLCSGGSDTKIHVWDFATMAWLREFTGHRKAVTGLTFRKGHHELFSCSQDRGVKVWNLDEMGYVDTMFGHQDEIQGIDSLGKERFLTCGGRDRSARIWKVAEESQLVFHAHGGCGSVDAIRLINEDHFVSGADDGSLSVWSVTKKKPVTVYRLGHCVESVGKDGAERKESTWISAITTLRYTDLIASGSRDGYVRIWECSEDYKTLNPVDNIPVKGFVNGLAFTPDGSSLVCAVGQEHKNGRWWRIKEARNSLVVIPLKKLPVEL